MPFVKNQQKLSMLDERARKDSGMSTTSDTSTASFPKQAVVIVDPYSTGCMVAKEIAKRGYELVALWTFGFAEEMKTHVPALCGPVSYAAEVEEGEGGLGETSDRVRKAAAEATGRSLDDENEKDSPVVFACIAGGEAGVDLADALSEYMRLRSNGTEIPNRRDKKVQQEIIRKVGLRSVRQAAGSEFSQVEPFLKSEPFPLVLKPIESAGSDGVKLCHNFEEAKEHFHVLMTSQMVNGGECPAVLCQEFLRGKEYVVDHVSRDGVHKTMMVWVYDKRQANGSAFVYFGCIPVDSESPEAKVLIPYVRGVLDAMGIRHGPTHGEVMLTDEGPCLIEMNCRAHGGDGCFRPLASALTGGYTQVEVSADACLEGELFRSLPDKPPSPFKAHGEEVDFVSFSSGVVKSMPGYEVVKNLPSFLSLETGGVKPGSKVDYTIDLLTGIGSVLLVHPDESVLREDIAFIRKLEKINGLFVYETKTENLKRPRGDQVVLDSKTKSDAAAATAAAEGGAAGHRRVFSSEGPTLIRHMSNDRPELKGPLVKRMTTINATKEAVVVVNPYSTGCCIAEEIMKRGYNVIALWTEDFSEEMKTHVPLSVGRLEYHAEVRAAKEALADTASAVYAAAGQLRVVACIAGGEAGVDLADALSERLQVRTNGTSVPNRFDKKVQQELIRKVGLRSIRQVAGSDLADVEPFLESHPYPLVLKPVHSAGYDTVKLCHNLEEARQQFQLLVERRAADGADRPLVLCQEFLQGKEYIVDLVSREGKHKTSMVWVNDKRPANGSAFVYFGCVPVDSRSPDAKCVVAYARRALDALGIRNGPSHAQVMMTNDGPCLLHVNCRAHGGDGNWRPLCRALTGGYSQIESAVDAYLDSRQFSVTPDYPPSPPLAHGQELILVSFSRGVVKSAPGLEEITKLPSFVYLETGVKAGSTVDYTVDLFTSIGSVVLMHTDKDVVENDVKRIRHMERNNLLFEYESAKVVLSSTRRTILKRPAPTKNIV